MILIRESRAQNFCDRKGPADAATVPFAEGNAACERLGRYLNTCRAHFAFEISASLPPPTSTPKGTGRSDSGGRDKSGADERRGPQNKFSLFTSRIFPQDNFYSAERRSIPKVLVSGGVRLGYVMFLQDNVGLIKG